MVSSKSVVSLFYSFHIVIFLGHCYQKVRNETEEMRSKIPSETKNFDAPTKEVQFFYEDDDPQIKNDKTKYVIEMKKKRPMWFNANLLSKGFGRFS